MRHHDTTKTTLSVIALALTFSLAGLSTASAEEPADDSEDEAQQSDDSAGSAIVDSDKTGLKLGGDDLSTDEALARVGGGRESQSDEDEANGSSRAFEGDEPPCEPYPSCARADLGSKDGDTSAERFQKIAESNRDELRACYGSALEDGESGRVTFHLVVASDGSLSDIELTDSSIGGDRAHSCARSKIADWDFPKPSEFGYESLKVTHPFVFRAAD